MDWLVGKFGFDEHLWRQLEPRPRSWLSLSTVLVLLSCTLFALGGGFVAYISATGHANQWWIALFIFVITFVLAFNFRRLFVLMGGYQLHQHLDGLAVWRPSRVRLVLITFMAIVFSQPLALLVTQSSYEKELEERIDLKVNYFELAKQSELKTRIDEQTLQIIRLRDSLSRLPVNASASSIKSLTGSEIKNNRKALLIGGSDYRNQEKLPNPKNDVRGMKKMLQGLGFDVVESLDERRDQILAKLIDHTRHLKAGDISLVFYAGHGLQFRGRNYIIPFDFPPLVSVQALRTYGIDVNNYVEMIDEHTPQLNLVMLDACRDFIGSTEQGLAKIEADKSRNTVIMLAAAPGKKASDGVGKNSPFTEAVLNNFPKQEDFSKIVSFITRDVSQSTGGGQKPVSTVSLIDVDFRLAQPIASKSVEQPVVAANDSSVNDKCREGGVENQQQCLSANMRYLDTRKKTIEKALLQNVPLQVAAYREAIHASGVLTDRWQLLWQSKLMAFVLSLAIVVILVIGDFMRDVVWLSPLKDYEKMRHIEARTFVKAKFVEMSQKAKTSFDTQKIVPSQNFDRWDPSSNFYRSHKEVQTSKNLVAVNDQTSWVELVGRLNQQESTGHK